MSRKEIIRAIYLYLFSLVGLALMVAASVQIVDLGLKIFIFKNAEEMLIYPEPPRMALDERGLKPPAPDESKISKEEREKFDRAKEDYQKKELQSRRERTFSRALAMLIVGIPLFCYHWRTIERERCAARES